MNTDIKIGDKVRSFDFDSRDIEGPDAHFVEGIVESEEVAMNPQRWIIRVTRVVFGGTEKELIEGERVAAPFNGLARSRGRITNGVVKIEAAEDRKAAFMAEKREPLEIVF